IRPFVVWSVQRIEDSRAHVTVTEPLTVSRLAWRIGPAKDTSTEPLTVFTFSGPSWPSTRTPPFTVDRTRSPARFAAVSRPFTVSASSASADGAVMWERPSRAPFARGLRVPRLVPLEEIGVGRVLPLLAAHDVKLAATRLGLDRAVPVLDSH